MGKPLLKRSVLRLRDSLRGWGVCPQPRSCWAEGSLNHAVKIGSWTFRRLAALEQRSGWGGVPPSGRTSSVFRMGVMWSLLLIQVVIYSCSTLSCSVFPPDWDPLRAPEVPDIRGRTPALWLLPQSEIFDLHRHGADTGGPTDHQARLTPRSSPSATPTRDAVADHPHPRHHSLPIMHHCCSGGAWLKSRPPPSTSLHSSSSVLTWRRVKGERFLPPFFPPPIFRDLAVLY